MKLAAIFNKWMSWRVVVALGTAWAGMTWHGYRSMQIEEIGIDEDVVVRYYDRMLRVFDAADRAGVYSKWVVGTSEKEETIKASYKMVSQTYAETLAEDGEELLELLSLKIGERKEPDESFEDDEFRGTYRSWLMAGYGQAWHYELFIQATGDTQVSKLYAEQNDRLLRRVVGMSLVFDLLILSGFGFAIARLVQKPPDIARAHRLPERWPASSVLGAFFGANLLLTPWSVVIGYIYDFFTKYVPETIAYTAYDLAWRVFDAGMLIFIFLKTPCNAWRVFRLGAPIHLPLLLVVFAAVSLFDLGLYYLSPLGEVDPSDFMETADPDLAAMLAMLFSSVILAPIFEEIVFRGFLFQGLRAKLGNLPAGVISTVLFTLVHVQYDIWGCLSVAAMGVGAAYLTLRTGSLNTAIIFHALINFLVTANVYFQYQMPL